MGLRGMGKFICNLFILLTLMSCASPQVIKDSSEGDLGVPWDTCSYSAGDHACNFKLSNQYGEEVNLYDFYGNTVVIDFSTMWCGPCAAAALEVQQVKDKFGDEFTYITVLIENSEGQAPSPDDCKDWSEAFGIKEPILAGGRTLMGSSGKEGWPITGWPTFFFIKKDMTIHATLRGFSSEYIEELIRESL